MLLTRENLKRNARSKPCTSKLKLDRYGTIRGSSSAEWCILRPKNDNPAAKLLSSDETVWQLVRKR